METHSGEKPYDCSECEFQCADERTLNEHMKVHSGEKPYDCSECEFQCADEITLNEHMKSHIGEKPSEVQKCSECTYEYPTYEELQTHLITHNIFACDKCKFRSNTKNGLKGHLGKKHNDKFKCSKCDFKGTSSTTLSNHLKTHTGEEICLAPQENEIKSSQSTKRGLSVSPDKKDLDNSKKRLIS